MSSRSWEGGRQESHQQTRSEYAKIRKKSYFEECSKSGDLAPLPALSLLASAVFGLVRRSGSFWVSCVSWENGCQSPGEGARMQGPMGRGGSWLQ